MRKVVVFDSGWGGEEVANWIEAELNVLDLVRVIDWRNAPYLRKTKKQIINLVDAALGAYWGKVDLVILASFVATSVIARLRQRHPEQKIIGMPFDLGKIREFRGGNVMILAEREIQREYGAIAKAVIGRGKVILPNCEKWTTMIDEGVLTKAQVQRSLKCAGKKKIGLVLVNNTHFWEIEEWVQEIFGWEAEVYDYRDKLMKDVNRVLEFDRVVYMR